MMHESTNCDLYVATNLRTTYAIKKAVKIMGACVIVILGLMGVVVAYLAYPGTPSESKFMAFGGYIELPKGGMLNVLDYITLNGRSLFVTSESSGSVFKIDLYLHHPSTSSISAMPGTRSAHSVVLLPCDNVA